MAVATPAAPLAGCSEDEYEPVGEGAVGYRFWRVYDGGTLEAPLGKGEWGSGLNIAGCVFECDRESDDCGACGFYACVHLGGDSVCEHYAFDPTDATVHWHGETGVGRGSRLAIFGSVVLFDRRPMTIDSRMRGGHGFIAALSLPPAPDPRVVEAAEAASNRLGVPLVPPDGLYDAALECLARAARPASAVVPLGGGLASSSALAEMTV